MNDLSMTEKNLGYLMPGSEFEVASPDGDGQWHHVEVLAEHDEDHCPVTRFDGEAPAALGWGLWERVAQVGQFRPREQQAA